MSARPPRYPWNPNTGKISLPPSVEAEIKQLADTKGITAAMKQVMALTGAGLKAAKDYIDALTGK